MLTNRNPDGSVTARSGSFPDGSIGRYTSDGTNSALIGSGSHMECYIDEVEFHRQAGGYIGRDPIGMGIRLIDGHPSPGPMDTLQYEAASDSLRRDEYN